MSDQIKHEQFDKLHVRLMALLDIIETRGDPTLARRRFDIMEEFGYDVALATNPTVVPFAPPPA